jgi:gamma-aminobutyric acid type B receptor
VLEDTNGIPDTLAMVGYIMVGINFTAAGICFVWLFLNRNSPQVRVSQPMFLSLVIVGCIISTSTILAMAQENTNYDIDEDSFFNVHTACMAIPWLYSVGFSITFGTLFAKIRHVYVLFKAAAGTTRPTISIKETLLIIGGVLGVDVLVLTVWTVVSPLRWERTILTMDKYQVPLSSEGYCTSDDWMIFAGILAALHLALLGFASYLCYLSRDIPTSKFCSAFL